MSTYNPDDVLEHGTSVRLWYCRKHVEGCGWSYREWFRWMLHRYSGRLP